MADTLTRRSPLQKWATRFAALPAEAAITEEPFVTMVDLWVDPSGAGASAAARVLGTALPTTPSTCSEGTDSTVIWFGPDEWLVTSTALDGEALETRLHAAVAEYGGVSVDVSAQRTSVRLRGAHARDVLAKGCALDLHPTVFGRGSAAQTMLALAAVVLIPLNDKGTDYRILVRSSFAGYLADWLIDAVEEFGVDW
ncbi:sarcosine oxidase subunit gamma [Mycolicibacterium wolinskyi]|uniref:Sarcosine oxidase subunit gamma n=1 Tax=Mycolicibacterium wolinskyi TaxID=59750 RepID=A0A1X2F884_9MYCO|nr:MULTISPECIES: sarcosine oxidase subunit gamma family protein [Mycolicibacterium]MCV7286671.1 sarcosine oxidase subunit gamma [Mycolicibacterium wolinskyi]MCV7293651.1 sarcosine oxidase subunit gamma [Mycolicibacterium goodii]ORX14627.1 sarcosine oxidase subunit gamma [Mycolicibacterium wolinskyi]